MLFLNWHQASSTQTDATHMSSSALEKAASSAFEGILIKVTRSQPATWQNMSRVVGVRLHTRLPKMQKQQSPHVKGWLQVFYRLAQSPLHLNERARARCHIHTGNIQRQRRSEYITQWSNCKLMALIRAEIVRWVSESLRPFEIVNNRGFQCLMKMGHPEYYIPSPSTVSRDVKLVFVNVRKGIAKMLQTYNGELNFATDVWTSPNHKAFVAVSVHLEHEGEPLAMLLDIIEVEKVSIHALIIKTNWQTLFSAQSHTGFHLAEAFAKILQDFGITDKVSHSLTYMHKNLHIDRS